MEKLFLVFLIVFSLAKMISVIFVSKTMKAPDLKEQNQSETDKDSKDDFS